MRIQLVIQTIPPRKVHLRDGYVYQIGRTDAADIVVPEDGHLSSAHFSLEVRSGVCTLRDLKSANGTLLNGKPVIEAVLEQGDVIAAGKTSFSLQLDGAPSASTDVRATEPLAPARETPSPVAGSPAAITPTPARPEQTRPTVATKAPPAVRTAAKEPENLRAVARPSAPPRFPDFETGWRDPDASVRRESMLAAIWTRQDWVLDRLRAIARTQAAENLDALWLLGVLGEQGDLAQMVAISRSRELGPNRFKAVGAFGHPGVVPELLRAVRAADPEVASAAGGALLKITGFNLNASRQQVALPDDADEFEREFADEVEVVDAEQADERWRMESKRFEQGIRWCRGHDVSEGAAAVLNALDMASRYEAFLRDHFRGITPATPRDVIKFFRPHRM